MTKRQHELLPLAQAQTKGFEPVEIPEGIKKTLESCGAAYYLANVYAGVPSRVLVSLYLPDRTSVISHETVTVPV